MTKLVLLLMCVSIITLTFIEKFFDHLLIIQRWDLTKKLACVTKDNASDMIYALHLLATNINNMTSTYRLVEEINALYCSHRTSW